MAFANPGTILSYGKNVRSVVVEIECSPLLGESLLLAVVSETLVGGAHPVRWERFGRPELENAILGMKNYDTVNRQIHPLTELLLADYQIGDVSKPYGEDTFLEIERAAIAGRSHETCGGRSLNDDAMDSLYTFLINANKGSRISDGVDRPSKLASQTFPYLVEPNPNPPSPPGHH